MSHVNYVPFYIAFRSGAKIRKRIHFTNDIHVTKMNGENYTVK